MEVALDALRKDSNKTLDGYKQNLDKQLKIMTDHYEGLLDVQDKAFKKELAQKDKRIAQKESDETKYWLELLSATDYLPVDTFNPLFEDASALLKIIRSIIISSKRNLNIL